MDIQKLRTAMVCENNIIVSAGHIKRIQGYIKTWKKDYLEQIDCNNKNHIDKINKGYGVAQNNLLNMVYIIILNDTISFLEL